MTAAALLAELRAHGIALTRITGDRLRASAPRGAVTPELAEAIRTRKEELLSLLAGESAPSRGQLSVDDREGGHGSTRPTASCVGRWPHEVGGAGPRGLTLFSPCALCGVGSWVTYGNTVLCPPCAAAPTTPVRLGYRAALRRCWTLMAHGDAAEPPDASQVRDELVRLIDEVGEPAATELRHRLAHAWWREQRTCPMCGGPTFHDPATGEEGLDA